MRTIIVIFLLVYSILPCLANDSETTQTAYIDMRIYELRFNDDSSWAIHLECLFRMSPLSGPHKFKFDSIHFYSSKGNALLKHVDYIAGSEKYNDSVFIFTKDSLQGNFDIDNESDSIIIVGYYEMDNEKQMCGDFLVYGNYKTSYISPLRIGQSIIEYGECKMNNSNSHCKGTLKGKIYDAKGNIFKGFNAEWVSIEIDSLGNYEIQRWARIDTLKAIGYSKKYTDAATIVSIKPIPYNVEPDSIYYADIHILDPANIAKYTSYSNRNLIFPNPVVDISYLESTGQFNILEVYNTPGDIIRVITIKNQTKIPIRKNEYIPGVYFYRLSGDRMGSLTGKFVVK